MSQTVLSVTRGASRFEQSIIPGVNETTFSKDPNCQDGRAGVAIVFSVDYAVIVLGANRWCRSRTMEHNRQPPVKILLVLPRYRQECSAPAAPPCGLPNVIKPPGELADAELAVIYTNLSPVSWKAQTRITILFGVSKELEK